MAVSPSFRAFVLGQLEPFAVLQARSMFGGVGIYGDGCFFALMDDDRLYFKVDEGTRVHHEALGMGPFLPFGDPERPMGGYYEVPGDLIEDPERLEAFVGRALAVAAAAAGKGAKKAPGGKGRGRHQRP